MALLQLARLLSVSVLLGLAADLHARRRAGLGWRNLRDLYNLAPLAASVSTVALAAITATLTAFGTNAAGVVVKELIQPPPAATTNANPGH